jgi:hypothetical protein
MRAEDLAKPLVRGLIPEGCKASVRRLKNGPELWSTVISEGEEYTDKSFKKKNMLYSWPYNNWWTTLTYDTQLMFWST